MQNQIITKFIEELENQGKGIYSDITVARAVEVLTKIMEELCITQN